MQEEAGAAKEACCNGRRSPGQKSQSISAASAVQLLARVALTPSARQGSPCCRQHKKPVRTVRIVVGLRTDECDEKMLAPGDLHTAAAPAAQEAAAAPAASSVATTISGFIRLPFTSYFGISTGFLVAIPPHIESAPRPRQSVPRLRSLLHLGLGRGTTLTMTVSAEVKISSGGIVPKAGVEDTELIHGRIKPAGLHPQLRNVMPTPEDFQASSHYPLLFTNSPFTPQVRRRTRGGASLQRGGCKCPGCRHLARASRQQLQCPEAPHRPSTHSAPCSTPPALKSANCARCVYT
jgi:hypothetical protein